MNKFVPQLLDSWKNRTARRKWGKGRHERENTQEQQFIFDFE